jgi:hypothetical protein
MTALLALSFMVFSCGGSRYMHRAGPVMAIVPPPGAASIIFVRPFGSDSSLRMTILDTRGTFLGDSLPSSQFAVGIPAGNHLLLAWAENTPALHAFLAPDRVYYVEVNTSVGLAWARAQLLAVKPDSSKWSDMDDWLYDRRKYVVDHTGGQAYLDSRPADVSYRIRRAWATWTDYSAEEREARTLRPGDGVALGGSTR